MLVLSRKFHEKIRIGDDIVVTIVEIGRGKVRLGFEAPRSVEIHREEFVDAMCANDREEVPPCK